MAALRTKSWDRRILRTIARNLRKTRKYNPVIEICSRNERDLFHQLLSKTNWKDFCLMSCHLPLHLHHWKFTTNLCYFFLFRFLVTDLLRADYQALLIHPNCSNCCLKSHRYYHHNLRKLGQSHWSGGRYLDPAYARKQSIFRVIHKKFEAMGSALHPQKSKPSKHLLSLKFYLQLTQWNGCGCSCGNWCS